MIGMAGQAVEHDDVGSDGEGTAKDADLGSAFDEATPEGIGCLIADN